ncbi:uncharacterized protein LOC108683023 isoform X2 [Hyalella azteca]|uniref:Uncharacterized protein LOC108683023 isoform X2 n=1 Tax=Hyalella azteca TaxID=294128 RepID=A0A8B7PNK5_HYAAZ|nr:uncharacterized protein LOC108683023 isoform X2 [Hyalella azteca]
MSVTYLHSKLLLTLLIAVNLLITVIDGELLKIHNKLTHEAPGIEQLLVTNTAWVEETEGPSHAGEIGDGHHPMSLRHSRVVRQSDNDAEPDAGSTETTTATTTTSTTTSTATSTTTTSTTTTEPLTTTVPNVTSQAPVISGSISRANISTFIEKNYNYSDHTSFDNGTNGWDFLGTWSKTDLNATEASKRPVPLPMEDVLGDPGQQPEPASDNNTDLVILPDQNNYVMICTVDGFSPMGQLKKSFPATTVGEVFIRYFIPAKDIVFNVTLVNAQSGTQLLYSNLDDTQATTNVWTTDSFSFKQWPSLALDYQVVLTVSASAGSTLEKSQPLLAVQHIAVGGMWPGGVQPTIAPPVSNETINPPGSAPYLEGLQFSIYTALYVFLAFFLLLIVALVVVVVRGRLRQKATRSASSDYDPNTAYRLDKVYDNPAYDASAT